MRGLNSLRFFAAFFVIISHGQISLWKLDILKEPTLTIFNRGGDGVEFFFTLSGFLITCLLIKEIEKTQTVSIKKFYLRRMFRIWPLYFFIVVIGFIVLGIIYPVLFHKDYFEFNIFKGLTLFLFFLPNLATSFYATGLLYPLWSIGVEEQYYLFWAPLLKVFKNNTLAIISVFLILSHLLYVLLYWNVFGLETGWLKFFLSQKFYAMAMGGFFAYIFMHKKSEFKSSFLSGKVLQAAVLILISYHYLVGFVFSGQLWFHFLLAILYGFLIIYTVLPGSIVNMEVRPFTYLGIISYGLYMYHMLIDYMLRLFFMKVGKSIISVNFFGPLFYHICLLGFTILLASLSFKYFESYFLKLKQKYS